MATFNPIANLFRSNRRFEAVQPLTAVHTASRLAVVERDVHAVREIPHERVYFFIKKIDNSGVVKEVNQHTEAMSWQTIGGACAAAVVLIGLLIPFSSNVFAGYRVHALQQETRHLGELKAELELEEARLLAPERLAELARIQKFIEAPKTRVIYSNPKADQSVAGLLKSLAIAPATLVKQ